MQIKLLKKNKFYKYPFPTEDVNKYWIYDRENGVNLIAIEKKNDAWYIISNDKCTLINGNNEISEERIELNIFYSLKSNIGGKIYNALLIITEENDSSFKTYRFINDGIYTIGTSEQNIIIKNNFVNQEHAIIIKNGNNYEIKAQNPNNIIYVNDVAVYEKKISNGDIVFIYGFKFIFINDLIYINNFNNNLTINNPNIQEVENRNNYDESSLLPTEDDDSAVLYEESEYFSRTPRFVTTIVDEDFKIDSPPGKVEADDTPVLYTIGPMLTMSMSSIVSATTSIINLQNGRGTAITVLPSMVISITMLASTLLWPTLTRKYQRKKQKKKEEERQSKYIEYLKNKKIKIENIRVNQTQVLFENYPDPENISNIIINKKRNLWERTIESDDFLNVRVGLGTIDLKIKLSYAKEDFTMVEDNLKDELKKVVDTAKEIENAPVVIDLIERNKLVIMGDNYAKESMLKNIILQLATYHSYNDLKIVFFVDDNFNNIFDNFKTLPHLWTNSRDIRFYADNYDDMTKISFYLEQTLTARKNNDDKTNSELTYKNFSPYYLIIIDNIKKSKNIEIVKKILEEENNLGYGLIILSDGISELPNECKDFLTASFDKSAIIKNDLNKDNQQTFSMDSMLNIDVALLSEKLSNIPIKLPLMLDELKSSLGFLEMYKVGNVEQLNIYDRWVNNNPVNSLSVPIGIHTDGEIFSLDLHEKFHGPHGLIAGMTGSGKSEFIITLILSLALNFNPKEVSFVIIDYKGGGLTGAFEIKSKGIKLPHLAGVITNLDKAEINRCLASIESELKRRQQLFNKAKDELNESTIDIYKYQKLYRDGKITEPISHLFIITDEFAELKSQRPEFMDELISAARIGRSLGVHLILATQKPSGIVDDQIWSNSKFKVCLKVQEKADSMDVIRCDKAAMLKKAGRFYLQVGYNDYFAMGQSAYTGTKYIPRENIVKTVDRTISFINNIGDTVKSVETKKTIELASYGEELPNILNYICENAIKKKYEASKLWLDAIPKEIFVNNLINKYKYTPEKWNVKAIIGEYDDPSNQRQDLLTIDFTTSGNTIVYGIEGKEIFLVSLVYSLMILHSPYEINIYIIDFGSESLGMFKKAPQVGDVVYITEKEKLINLFNKITRELDRRKKIFTEYNGDYNIYIKNSGKTLPRIVIIVNNYELLSENYDDYVDIIASLSREGEKYGIAFVLSATGVNAVRGKTTQNFGNIFGLQFNDPSDYSSILGSTKGLVPMDILGRGLTKVNGALYEFQTAYAYKWDEITAFIKNISNKLNMTIKYAAETIKVLPEFVRFKDIEAKISTLSNVPVGIEKQSLNISTFDFSKQPISLVSCQDPSVLDTFIPSLCQVLENIEGLNTIIIDWNDSVKDKETFKNYYNSDAEQILNIFNKLVTENNNYHTIFVMNGFNSYMNDLSKSNKLLMQNLLLKIKDNSNVKVIIADDVSKIKQYEYEEFYRSNVQPLYAIWIGSGITDQYTIKNTSYSRETRAQLENNFGWNVNRGISRLIKVIDFYTKE